jgi:3-phenylpropionate/cinnamic acid dioxygenase small subunit
MNHDDLIRFVYHEARLLDEKHWDEWYALFTDDAFYWVPLTHDQPDGMNHTSLAYEDKLLLQLRIERLKRNPFSQQPVSRSQHVLQRPEVELADDAAGRWILRTAFYYAEARLDTVQMYTGVTLHHLVRVDGTLRIELKRVNLLNCDAALPSIQLFI